MWSTTGLCTCANLVHCLCKCGPAHCWHQTGLEKCIHISERQYIEKNQLSWTEHTQLPKIILYGVHEYGVRTSGGQRKCYKDQLRVIPKKLKLTDSWDKIEKDRNKWRSIIQNYNGAEWARKSVSNTKSLECDICWRLITSTSQDSYLQENGGAMINHNWHYRKERDT